MKALILIVLVTLSGLSTTFADGIVEIKCASSFPSGIELTIQWNSDAGRFLGGSLPTTDGDNVGYCFDLGESHRESIGLHCRFNIDERNQAQSNGRLYINTNDNTGLMWMDDAPVDGYPTMKNYNCEIPQAVIENLPEEPEEIDWNNMK